MNQPKIAVVKIHYHFLNSLVMTVAEYNGYGKWKGLIQQGIIYLREVSGMEMDYMTPMQIASLPEWQP